MSETREPRKRVLFLFSDTGGGHRSATEAMMEALDAEFPGRFTSHKVDFFREYYPRPLKYAPEMYPPISRVPNASASRVLAEPGRSGFCWLSCGAQPESHTISKVARMRPSGSAKRSA